MRKSPKWLVALVLAMSLTAAIMFTVHNTKVTQQKFDKQVRTLKAQTKAQHDAEVDNLKKQIDELNVKLQSKAAEKARLAAVEASKTPVVQKVVQSIVPTAQAATGSHTEWMAAAGISPSDYQYVEFIVQHESTWRYWATNPSGATGLCQSLPASKMATAGADYLTNPVTQLKWCNSYAQSRYGGWANSWAAWQRQRWW